MERYVLVLDCGFLPIRIVHWTKAIEMLLLNKAQVVEEYAEIKIRSERLAIALPSVLKLSNSHKNQRCVKFSRSAVFWRDKYTCQYCGERKQTQELTFDHVIPKHFKTPQSSRTWENIVSACRDCNRRKGGRTPEEANMKLLSTPKKPSWSPGLAVRIQDHHPPSWKMYVYWEEENSST